MEYKIKEKFFLNLSTYQVEESQKDYPSKCEDCSFYDKNLSRCNGTLSVTGDCIKEWRSDKKEVVFKIFIND